MKNIKLIFLTLLIFIVGINCVAASDICGTVDDVSLDTFNQPCVSEIDNANFVKNDDIIKNYTGTDDSRENSKITVNDGKLDIISIEDNGLKKSNALKGTAGKTQLASPSKKSFTDLDKIINEKSDLETIDLNDNYVFNPNTDSNFKKGICINRPIEIFGNGITIDGANMARIFNVTAKGVIFHNINFINGCISNETQTWGHGGAIVGKCDVYDSTFTNCSAEFGGAIAYANAINCTFLGNHVGEYEGGAMFYGKAINCTFKQNMGSSGGAIYKVIATGCKFIENKGDCGTAAMRCELTNCTFSGNIGNATVGYSNATNCNFTNNYAEHYSPMSHGNAANCIFINNSADIFGGAMFDVRAINCTLKNNNGDWGGAMYLCDAINCTFINNIAKGHGGAMASSNATNCTFIKNVANRSGGALYESNAINSTFVLNYGVLEKGIVGSTDIANMENKEHITENCEFIVPKLVIYRYMNITDTTGRLFFKLEDGETEYSNVDTTINVYKDGEIVGTYHALSGKSWGVDLDKGTYDVVLSVDNTNVEPIHTTLDLGTSDEGNVTAETGTLTETPDIDTNTSKNRENSTKSE